MASIPACRPKRFSFLIEVCAQCIVPEEASRIAVLTATGRVGISWPGAGQGSPCTTRMKK